MVVVHNELNDFVTEPVFGVPNIVLLNHGEQVGSISLHLIDCSLNEGRRQIVGFECKGIEFLLLIEVEHPAVTLTHDSLPTRIGDPLQVIRCLHSAQHHRKLELQPAREILAPSLHIDRL